MIFLPDKKYQIIYADPPWSFNNKNTGGSMTSGAASQYPVMRLNDICEMDVGGIADDNAFLFMWWVASQPQEALDVVKAWGFTLKNMTDISWVKKTITGKDHFGMGYYTRSNQEQCLVAIKGRPKVVSHSERQNVRAVNYGHSVKPSEARNKIVDLCGDLPRIELFARQRVPGWDAWGNDV